MKIEEVIKCSFPSWYDDFKAVTFKSIILPLPDDVVSYILSDGIILPESSQSVVLHHDKDSDASSDEVDWDEEPLDQEAAIIAPKFPDFEKRMDDAVENLGGRVFPKLNWSAPRDASWIMFNNCCCCSNSSDIYLLLKSSDLVVHDLTNMFSLCEDFETIDSNKNAGLKPNSEKFYLILRKWIEIDTSGEYRCFVKNNVLIGISQREHSLYFDHILRHKNEIIKDIVAFYTTHIRNKFPLPNFVFDVYRNKKEKVFLVDFNPFGKVTESLLFDWTELQQRSVAEYEDNLPEFRFVNDNYGIQPRVYSHHAVPRDIVDISSGADSFKLVDLMKLKVEEQSKVSDEEEDEKWAV